MHLVARMHQRRVVDFRKGRKRRPASHRRYATGLPATRQVRRLGREDQVVELPKPRERPAWIGRGEFDALPDVILLRELRYTVRRPGSRTRQVTLLTTLLDAEAYPKAAVVELYASRWEVETNLRHLKQTLGLDVLRCKTREGGARGCSRSCWCSCWCTTWCGA